MGVPPQIALGTNKFASTFGTSVALINFVRNKKVVWKLVISGILFSLLGAFVGSKTILIFSNETVGRIILLLLPLAMLATLVPKREPDSEREWTARDLYVKIPLICSIIGFYDGFFGPGTGSFLIMAFYVFVGLDLVQASATAKVFNLTSCIGSLIVFVMENKVFYLLGFFLAIANIAGNYLGSQLAIAKGTGVVKSFLIASFTILFISLSIKFFV